METILQRLTDLDDVSGAILVGKDGLIVTGIAVQDGRHGAGHQLAGFQSLKKTAGGVGGGFHGVLLFISGHPCQVSIPVESGCRFHYLIVAARGDWTSIPQEGWRWLSAVERGLSIESRWRANRFDNKGV